MTIVTSGSRYIDIDAYAGCIAYANLLNLKGKKAKAVSSANFNESITPSLRHLAPKFEEYEENKEDKFIIIDVSDPSYFDTIVKYDEIIEIIDHHTGFEMLWKNQLGEKAKIEFIGAVATLIVEVYEQENLLEAMSQEIAYLLMAAILDNTLNFQAKITTKRDNIAYQKLENRIQMKENYAEKYFSECQVVIEKNLKKAIENDTKIERVSDILPPVFGQLTIWDKQKILENKFLIEETLNQIGTDWMMNLICLKDGKSYILAKDAQIQKNLENLLNGTFEGDTMELGELWLRKEIIKKARENETK